MKDLFDQMTQGRPLTVTGATASAKSFNLVLILLYFHTHGNPMQRSALVCNQKSQGKSALANAEAAVQFYQSIMPEDHRNHLRYVMPR